jgi:hypothetical protein
MAWRVTLMRDPARILAGVLLVGGALTSREVAGQNAAHLSAHSVKAAAPDPGPGPVITLERSACHNQCAEYRLSFYEDGMVVYVGGANASKGGRWHAMLPQRTVNQLVAEFQRIGFTKLDDKYPGGLNPSALAITSLRSGDKIKTVTHEVDSPFPPASLAVLEDRLDAAVQSVDWVK